MRYYNHRHSICCNFFHNIKNSPDPLRIKSTCWLIKQHNLRFCCKRSRYSYSLLLPSGKTYRVFISLLDQSDTFQQMFCFLHCLDFRHLLNPNQSFRNILQSSLVLPEIIMLKYHARLFSEFPDLLFILFSGFNCNSINGNSPCIWYI